jgi:hypothetical protein
MVQTFALVFALVCVSFSSSAAASILPPNDLHLEDQIGRADAAIDEALFRKLIDEAVEHYAPLARSHFAELSAGRDWQDPTVNAFALRAGPIWMVTFKGGLARRPEMTADGFQLVVCHELGHLFAGYPFKRPILGGFAAASTEGESDYFATQSCARTLWKPDFEENAVHAASVDGFAASQCDRAWSVESDRHLCYRIANASMSLARLLAVVGKESVPAFGNNDLELVDRTSAEHPAAQCRLDTYLEGSICTKNRDERVIPGKWLSGNFGPILDRFSERQALRQSCGSLSLFEGARPRCWFHPVLSKS